MSTAEIQLIQTKKLQKSTNSKTRHQQCCPVYLCTLWVPCHVPFCDQGSGSHVLGRCLSSRKPPANLIHGPMALQRPLYSDHLISNSCSPRMSPKTAGFWRLYWSRIHIPKKLPWDVLSPPDYIPPVVTWWWHCFPNPGTSPASSTSHQSANVQPCVTLHDTCSPYTCLHLRCQGTSPVAGHPHSQLSPRVLQICGVTTNCCYSWING